MQNKEIFNGKIIIITGGASGIGKAICLEFAKVGGIPIILDKDQNALFTLQEELKTLNLNFFSKVIDLTNLQEIKLVVEEVKQRYGKVDILINNVGIGSAKRFFDTKTEDFDLVIATNIKGPLFLTQEVVSLMEPGANIVFISSIFATQPSLDLCYDLTKAAINHLVTDLALQLAHKEIRVNGIAPGHIDTKTTTTPRVQSDVPLFGKAGLPADVAKACLFLTNNDSAGYITGAMLPVTGGLHLPVPKDLSV